MAQRYLLLPATQEYEIHFEINAKYLHVDPPYASHIYLLWINKYIYEFCINVCELYFNKYLFIDFLNCVPLFTHIPRQPDLE